MCQDVNDPFSQHHPFRGGTAKTWTQKLKNREKPRTITSGPNICAVDAQYIKKHSLLQLHRKLQRTASFVHKTCWIQFCMESSC